MKNKDRIRNMTDKKLYDFLDNFTWEEPCKEFSLAFCNHCEPVIRTYNDREIEFAPCEFDDYVCPHYEGDALKWWLEQEAKDV